MATNKSPTTSWIYDLEVYPNMFEASFIPYGVPQDIIDLYIAADIAKNKEDKRLILEAMGAKTFIIYRAYHEDKFERQNMTLASWMILIILVVVLKVFICFLNLIKLSLVIIVLTMI